MPTSQEWKSQYQKRIEAINRIIKASQNAQRLEYALMGLCKVWEITPKTFRDSYVRLAIYYGLTEQEKRRVRKALRMRGI